MVRVAGRALRGLFFDIDDTLFSSTEFVGEARRAALENMRRFGLKADLDHLARELEEIIAEFGSNYERHFDQLLNRVGRERYRGVNPAVLLAAAVVGYHETKQRLLRPFEDAAEALGLLSRTSLLLGIVSAGLAVKQAEKLVRLGLCQFFQPEAIFISDQMGISKPNPKIFQRATAAVGLDPAECLYVGNHPVHDIDAANSVGFGTVRVFRGG
ncbi:MAG: HAD-IA family hydrolase [Planctomycetes bacterium]|nr:HAD-IA family hydrolase [Planctomycetota bacterium]